MKFREIFIIMIVILVSCKPLKMETQIEKSKAEINVSEFPKQIGFVNDFENIFTDAQESHLIELLSYFKESSNGEIVVVTINPDLSSENFDKFAIEMSDNWKVGNETNGNGLTFIISKELRKIRISTTDKTRLYIPDEFCKQVIDETIIPHFKKEEYYLGTIDGLNRLMEKWE